MKFLITGSTGLIGSHFISVLEKTKFDIYSCYHQKLPTIGIPLKIDLKNSSSLSENIREIDPDIIIHFGALTDVDRCQSNPKLAHIINALSTKQLSLDAERIGSHIVYLSTDYVFDGLQGMYSENDITNPINEYGQSKLDGETFVKNIVSNWTIIRTSTPFGNLSMPKTFPEWVINNLKSNKKINVVDDQYTSPTFIPNLSKMILEVINKKISGVLHLSGSTRISRYEFAKLFLKNFDLEESLLIPVKQDTMAWLAKRPKDSSLNVSKASSILNEKPYSVEKSLTEYTLLMRHSLSL